MIGERILFAFLFAVSLVDVDILNVANVKRIFVESAPNSSVLRVEVE